MSGNVEIVIGAKDQASAVLQKVARETAKVGRSADKLAFDASRSGKMFSAAIAGMINPLKSLAAAYLSVQGVKAFVAFLGESAAASDEAAEAERALAKAIEMSGSAAGPTIEQHKQMAASLQMLIGVDGDAVIALMKHGSMLGVSNSKLQNTTKAAIGLAEAIGIDSSTAMQKLSQAMHGNLKAFDRLIPGIRNASTEEEKLAMIQELATKGLKQKEDRSKTALGMTERLTAAWGDFRETIGALQEPMRQFTYGVLVPLIETINRSLIPAVESMRLPLSAVKIALHQIRWEVTSFVTVIEVAATSVGEMMEALSIALALPIMKVKEDIIHVLTVAIPAYAKWLAENLVNMFKTALALVKSEFVNLATSVGEVMSAMWEAIKSGGEAGSIKLATAIAKAMQRGLTEGFEAQTTELPNVAERNATAMEKMMEGRLAKILGGIAGKFAKLMADRMKDAKENFDIDPLTSEGDPAKKIKQDQPLQAVQSRLLTRGPGSNPVLEETKKVVQGIGVMTKLAKMIADNTEPKQKPGIDMFEVGIA